MKFSFPGLTDQEVQASRAQHGSNAVTPQVTETFLDKLIDNLKDPIIVILIVALVITVALAIFGYTHWYEGVGIAIAVVLATLVATWSEYSNEAAFQKLLEEASLIQVKVFRNGRLVEISINDLVVGDHVLLQPGDNVPTDGVLVAGHLEVSQAALTGESEPLRKRALESEEAPIDQEHHVLLRASLVEDGEAVMRATAVGDKTQYGATLREITGAEDRLSPLQEKLTVLGKQISTFGYIGASFIALAFMLNKIYFAPDAPGDVGLYWTNNDMGQIISHVVTAFILSIIVIVMAVPEGLPMMIAIVLSLNMRKLLNAKVLVRKLLGIETAGSLTVLFTDKTGTLTQGQLVVADLLAGDHQHYVTLEEAPDALRDLIAFSLRNNTSAVIDAGNPDSPGIVGADRTEQALLRFLGRRLADKDEIDIVDLIPFNSTRKFSGMQVRGERNLTLIKGAPEIVLQNCTHYMNARGERVELNAKDAFNAEMHTLSERAMRLIAVAVSTTPIGAEQTLPEPLTLVGILGLRDELRAESYGAVKRAKTAGIHVVMITGDAKETAQAIAKDVGLLEGDTHARIITSAELAHLSDAEVKNLLPHLYVVARAFPTDKSRLVKLAKEMGWVVGMTGDGVNDAPAVKNADVGFAMGSGTEMTKESSDIVILDDNFRSLTQAVLYGRTLFKSIRKFLAFQLTVSLSAILLAFLGPFMGYDLPLTMVQLLWINIIIDSLAALAFSGEAALNRYMLEKPIPKDAHLITAEMWASILINGLAATMLSLIFLKSDAIHQLFVRPDMTGLLLDPGKPLSPENNLLFLTAFFGFFVFLHNFNKFNVRTDSLNLMDHLVDNRNFLGVISLTFGLQIVFTYQGGDILRTVGLTLTEWGYVLLLSVLIIPVDLLRKTVRNQLFGNPVLTAAGT
jgi:calcium-translocating P-type ATPase